MRLMRANPALAAVEFDVCRREECRFAPRDGLVVVDSDGDLHAHPDRLAEPAAWAWALAHAVLHLGFGHVPAAKGERNPPHPFGLPARCPVVHPLPPRLPLRPSPPPPPAPHPDRHQGPTAAP